MKECRTYNIANFALFRPTVSATMTSLTSLLTALRSCLASLQVRNDTLRRQAEVCGTNQTTNGVAVLHQAVHKLGALEA